MSRVRGSDTGPELALRRALWQAGVRGWRLRPKGTTGKPDIAFIGKKVAIFCDGCFWHGCPKCYRRPASNQSYWDQKARRNRERDQRVTDVLHASGWAVIRLWEHDINTNLARCVAAVLKATQSPAHNNTTRQEKPRVKHTRAAAR